MEQKKKALGRGLEQLFSTEVLDFESFENNIMESASESDILQIPVGEIRPNPYQPRKTFDQQALDELATSIRNYGVFQPIIVKKSIKGYDLIAGERRLRASKLAGMPDIPAIVKNFTDNEMREIALLENLQRENLNVIEEALAYKAMIEKLGLTQDELSKRVGKSRSHITNMLGLLTLPEDIQNQISERKITMGHARVLSKLDSNIQQKELAEKIITEGLSVRQLEEMTTSDTSFKRTHQQIKKQSNKLNEYQYVQDELCERLGTKVKIKNNKIEINFVNGSDLNRILEVMNIIPRG